MALCTCKATSRVKNRLQFLFRLNIQDIIHELNPFCGVCVYLKLLVLGYNFLLASQWTLFCFYLPSS